MTFRQALTPAATMLYTFTHYATLYELYVGLLRGLIAVAVCLSMLISVDRLYKVRVLP